MKMVAIFWLGLQIDEFDSIFVERGNSEKEHYSFEQGASYDDLELRKSVKKMDGGIFRYTAA